MPSWLPASEAPVWDATAGVVVLAPLLLPIGYYMMRYPRSALFISHVTTVEDEESFTGFAVARTQAAGFFTLSFGISALCFAAVSVGLPPVALPVLVALSGVVTALTVRAGEPRLQYLGIGIGAVASGALLTLLFAVFVA